MRYRVSRGFRRASQARMNDILREITTIAKVREKIARRSGVEIHPDDVPPGRDPFEMAREANEALRRAVA